ncbi:uncharacterized protein ACOB8E_001200 isoform 2-T9 [Sarcophilus harrisii]
MRIFNFGKKKGQFPSRPSQLSSSFGVQTHYPTEGYLIRSKDLRKIHKAALRGDVEKVQQQLLLGKNNVNDLDKVKRTPLHLACANGHPDVVSLLVEKNCNLNLLDNDSRTPLMKAIECGQKECATILLEHGADPNLRDGNNNTALHYAVLGHNKFMAKKLLQYQPDIEAKNKEDLTPLLLAIIRNNIKMADILLKNGANVNAVDSSNRTALMIAVTKESTGLVTLLLHHNADHTIQDVYGWTAELYAKQYGYPLLTYHQQIENQKECNKPSTSQISCSEQASGVKFPLGVPFLHKKAAEESSSEDSISRYSDIPEYNVSQLNTEKEFSFDMECSSESVLERSSKFIVASTSQNIQDVISLGQHEDLKQELKGKAPPDGSQDILDKSDQEQDKVTLETTSIPEETASKTQFNCLCFPFLTWKRRSQRPKYNKKSHGNDMHLDDDSNWKESHGKMEDEEKKMKVKNKIRMKKTELKQVHGAMFNKKDKIADQTKEKLPKNDFEELSKEFPEASSTVANALNDSEEKEKSQGLLRAGFHQSFPERKEHALENDVLKNLQSTSQENILQVSSDVCSQSSTPQAKNDNKPEVECTCNVSEEDIAYNAENMKRADSKRGINEKKEDAVIQEQKPELYTARKCKEKKKHIEILFDNNHYNASNSPSELRHWGEDKISKMHLHKELNQDTQRLTNALGMLQAESLASDKEKLPSPKEDKGEMAADTLDDLTQSLEKDAEDCNFPPSNYIKDSICLWEYQEEVVKYESSVKMQLKNIKSLEEMISGPQEKFSKRSKTKSQLRHYNVECDRELYGGRLEGEKQSRERLQTEMNIPSSVSSAILDHEHPTSKLILQQVQDELLPLKEKLLVQLSEAKNERYQLCDSLREKTFLVEISQRKLNQLKDKIKEHEDQIHTENENLNRSFLRQESIPEGLTHMQRENTSFPKPFKDAQNKGVFKVGTLNCVLMPYENNLTTLYTDTGKLDVNEEQNKDLADEYIHLREQLHKHEKEKAERLDTIRKLRQQHADFQKEQFMTSKSKIYEEILKQKQLQKELDEIKRKLKEAQEEKQQKWQYVKDLKDYIQKLKMKRATFEDSVKQQMRKSEKIQKNTLHSPLFEYLKKHLDELTSKNRHLEYMNTKLKEEIMECEELDIEDNLERSKLKYNRVEPYTPKIKVQVKQETEEQNDLFLQFEYLKKHLDELTSKNRHLEYRNTKLKEEIMECDELDLEDNLERLKLKYNWVEPYTPKIKIQVKQETEELNDLFLQIQDLEAEVLKMKISHQETKAKLERCKKDYSQEYRK